jgi:hypothetical protein
LNSHFGSFSVPNKSLSVLQRSPFMHLWSTYHNRGCL